MRMKLEKRLKRTRTMQLRRRKLMQRRENRRKEQQQGPNSSLLPLNLKAVEHHQDKVDKVGSQRQQEQEHRSDLEK